MRVREVMTHSVFTVRPETPFKEIAETLVSAAVSGVPVVDEDGTIAGIVTEEDLITKEAYAPSPRRRRLPSFIGGLLAGDEPWFRKAQGVTAGDVMTRQVVTVEPDATVHEAARLMIEMNVKRLPVVDEEGRLVGIVSRGDIVRIFARDDGQLKDVIVDLLRRTAFVEPDHRVTVAVGAGIVTLEGKVAYEGDIRVVEALVGAVDGVVGVDNRLLYSERDPRASKVRV